MNLNMCGLTAVKETGQVGFGPRVMRVWPRSGEHLAQRVESGRARVAITTGRVRPGYE